MKAFTKFTIPTLFLALFAVAGGSDLAAQVPRVSSVLHFHHTMQSPVLGEERSILVHVPFGYEKGDTRYPVVYMLDAHQPQNAMMVGIVEQQAWSGVMPEVILVGIQNTSRTRDMTPTATERRDSGGGPKFLQFIETEVIPMIDKNYRTQPYRIFAGHSLGGLFVFYSFLERPNLFNAYIAASPVFDWDKGYVIKRAEDVFKNERDWRKSFYVGLGDEPELLDSFNSLQALLRRTRPRSFDYEFQQFKDENHGSVVLPAYYAGLRKIYSGWVLPRASSLSSIEGHYSKLSKQFGYTILPPETMVNQFGYAMLRAGKDAEAIEAFTKNSENYPNSANVYDSLGEALEKADRFAAARVNYEKALNIAEKQNNTELARVFKANLDRVLAKLR